MSKAKEIIEMLKRPLGNYHHLHMHQLYMGHLLDREECDSVIAIIEAGSRLADVLYEIGVENLGRLSDREMAKRALKDWENIE